MPRTCWVGFFAAQASLPESGKRETLFAHPKVVCENDIIELLNPASPEYNQTYDESIYAFSAIP
jgi:hypothetical protein